MSDLGRLFQRPALLRGVLILLAILSLARSIGVARDRGMDHSLQTLDFHFVAAAIAISQVYHDAPGHYLGYPVVYSTLTGVAAAGQDPSQTALFRIVDIRPAFRAAMALSIPLDEKRSGPFFLQDTPNDIGYVDFVSLALAIWNRDAASLYLLYFSFLGASAALFIIGHWRRLDALAWLALGLVASNLLIAQSGVFNDPLHQLQNVHDYRFVSSLAIIPALHLAAWILAGNRLGPLPLLAGLGQTVLLALAIWFRSSAVWVLFGVAFCWLALWIPHLRPAPAGERNAVLRHLAVGALVAGTLLCTNLLLERRVDPDYADQSLTTSYLRWHAAYVGFAADRETWNQRKSAKQTEGFHDENAYAAAEEVIRSQRLDRSALMRQDGTFAWKWYDATMRRLVIDYLLMDPFVAVQLYLWHKPLRFLSFIVPEVLKTLSTSLVGLGLAAAALLAASASLAATGAEGSARRAAAAALCFAVASAAPAIFAYTLDHGMADQVFIGAWALLLASAASLAIVVRRPASSGSPQQP